MAKGAGKTSNRKTASPPGRSAAAKAAGRAPDNTGLWWGGLGCGAAVILSPASAILLAVLVMPVLLVALLPEDGDGRRVALAALLFGLAGSIYPLHQLWDIGNTIPNALTISHRPMALLAAWTAILVGWFLCEIAGIVLRLAADLAAASKRRSCMAELALLEAEWGPLPPTTIAK